MAEVRYPQNNIEFAALSMDITGQTAGFGGDIVCIGRLTENRLANLISAILRQHGVDDDTINFAIWTVLPMLYDANPPSEFPHLYDWIGAASERIRTLESTVSSSR